MQEDIKLKIGADTTLAKKDIEKLSKIQPKFTVEIATKLKNKSKLEKDIEDITSKLENAKINPEAFPKEQIKQWTRELKKAKKELKEIKIGTGGKFFREAFEEAKILKAKVQEIKLSPENFDSKYIKELQRQIEVTALKAKALNFTERTSKTQNLVNNLKNTHQELGKITNKADITEKVFSKMDLVIGNIVSSLITNGVSALKNMVIESTKLNAQLEYADKKIQSISDKNSIEIQSNIGKLSLETGTDPIELRNGLYEIISAVGDVEEAYDLLETSNKLAITGFTDIGNAVDGLTTVLNAYRMELSEAEKVANIFVKTQKLGKITVDEFSRDLAQSIPYATQLGVTIEEIGSAIALLTSRGVRPAQAETQLASFLRNILDDNNELSKTLKEQLGMTAKQYIENGGNLIKIIEEISNLEKNIGKAVTSFSMDSEGKAFVLMMKDNTEAYRNFYKEISSGKDEINKNMASIMTSQQAALNRAIQYWKELGRTVGSVTGEIIAYLGDTITRFDKQTSATKILNANLKQSLETLQDLGDKNNKTAEEQKSLNEALSFLKIIAPEISEAYKSWSEAGGDYADVLKLIEERQKKINDISNQMTLKDFDKDIAHLEKELKKVQFKIDRMSTFDVQAGTYISIDEKVKQGIISETSNSDKYLKYIELKAGKEKLQKELDEIKKTRQQYTDKLLGKTTVSEVIETGKNIPKIKELDLSPKQKPTKSDEELEKEKLKKEEDYRNRQLEIETAYNNARLKATQTYNTQMAELKGQGTEQEIQAIKEAYQKALTEAEFTKQKDTITNKMENTFYDNDNDRTLNNKYLQSEKDFLIANNEMEIEEQERKKAEEDRVEAEKKLKESLDNVSKNLGNLSSLFQTIGDNTGSQSMKNLSNILSTGKTAFDFLNGREQGMQQLGNLLGMNKGEIESLFGAYENFSVGAGIGSSISSMLGGGTEGNIGSLAGSAIGTAVGGPVGSVVGGAIGGAVGSVFGSKSKKKKKREAEKRKKALERLKRGQISGQYAWQLIAEDWAEEMEESGLGTKIDTLDKVSANVNYDNVLSTLNSAKRGKDGVSMSALKQLMPQYTESEIMDWFKSITGGAVLNGDTLSTGEGKYGAIDISALAQQVTNVNRELEQQLKETIKNIIDFTADGLASVVKEGFFDGIEDLGDNIEKMIANSLKNAFINTEISKNLFNGLSDRVTDYIKDMFKNDPNLGIDLETGKLEDLSFTQYIDLIKKYIEMSNDKLEDLFKELGLNMDNLTQSMDTLNKNMSKNTVTGIATNLWKQNLGIKEPFKIDQKINLEIPVTLNGKELDRYIIKTVNGSLQRSRRSGNGIGRG